MDDMDDIEDEEVEEQVDKILTELNLELKQVPGVRAGRIGASKTKEVEEEVEEDMGDKETLWTLYIMLY